MKFNQLIRFNSISSSPHPKAWTNSCQQQLFMLRCAATTSHATQHKILLISKLKKLDALIWRSLRYRTFDYRMVDGVGNADRWLWRIDSGSRPAESVDQLVQPGPPAQLVQLVQLDQPGPPPAQELRWPNNSPDGHLDNWTDKTISPANTRPIRPIQRGHDLPPFHQHCHLLHHEKAILVLKGNYCEKCQKCKWL